MRNQTSFFFFLVCVVFCFGLFFGVFWVFFSDLKTKKIFKKLVAEYTGVAGEEAGHEEGST
jgi:hypothetical protein